MAIIYPHVEETGEMVGYILFSRWKGPCLVCGKQNFEGWRNQVRQAALAIDLWIAKPASWHSARKESACSEEAKLAAETTTSEDYQE